MPFNSVTTEAMKRNKLTALSETGGRRGMSDWWSTVLLPVVSKYPVGYVLTWRHAYRPAFARGNNAFKPFPDDFMNFYNSPANTVLKGDPGGEYL